MTKKKSIAIFTIMDLYDRVVKAKLLMDEHYDSPLSLDEICDTACFSKFHFIRLFRKIYHKTPHQYLAERRIEITKIRIATTDHPIADICFEAGFHRVTSFTLKFKQLTGKTPGAYRQRAKELQEIISEHPQSFIPGCFASMFSK